LQIPEPIPTDVRDETFAGVTYHIRGQLVPELQIDLGDRPVMHEHHVLLWKETPVEIELKKLPGGVKRKIAGLDFFVTRAKGPDAWRSRAIPQASASRCTSSRARSCTCASTSSSPPRTTSTTRSSA